MQAAVNLRLGAAVKTPYGASTIQLGIAAVLLAILTVATGSIGALALAPETPAWHLLGGLASPLYITSGILLFPRLGAMAAVGLFVTGQMFASLGLDLFGFLGVAKKPLTVGIVLGAVAILAGITMVIRGQRTAAAPKSVPVKAQATVGTTHRPPAALARSGWMVLGVVAGAVLPIQGALNARLRGDLHDPLAVALISFVVATLAIALVLVVLLMLRRTSPPQLHELRSMPWWGWLGAACAAAYVAATFMLIPEIGASTTIALTVTGQQITSALIDNYGWFRLPKRRLTSARVAGLCLLIAGSVLVQLG